MTNPHPSPYAFVVPPETRGAVLELARRRAAAASAGGTFTLPCRLVAAELRISTNHALHATQELVSLGLLERRSRGGGPGRFVPTEYALTPAGAAARPAPGADDAPAA